MRSLSSLRQNSGRPEFHTQRTALAKPIAHKRGTAQAGASAASSGVVAIFGMLKGWMSYTLSEQT